MRPDRVGVGLDDVLARLAQLEAVVERLAGRGGARDTADAALMGAIAAEIGSQAFTALQLWRHREYAPALAAALRDADLAGAAEIGCWCRELGDRVIENRRLVKGKRSSAARYWRLELIERPT